MAVTGGEAEKLGVVEAAVREEGSGGTMADNSGAVLTGADGAGGVWSGV